MVKMKFGSEETRKRLREKAENKVFRELVYGFRL
jgi:hypothetical protein